MPVLAAVLLWQASASGHELAGYLTLTSDYVWRGVTQSDGNPAAQFGLDYNLDNGWYAGIWAATVDISNGPTRQRDAQVNYYAGYSRNLPGNWTLGGHVVAYTYPGADSDVDYDYNEYSLSASFQDQLWVEFSYSDDLYNTGESTRDLEIYFEQPIVGSWMLGGGAGYYDVADTFGSGYGYWQIGVTRTIGVLDVDLRFHDTNRWVPAVSSPDRADSRVALSIRWSF